MVLGGKPGGKVSSAPKRKGRSSAPGEWGEDMGKAGGGLTARTVAAAKHPGTPARPVRMGDGGGLYLQIAPAGSKSWLFRFTLAGKAREMGLGPVGEPPKGVAL